jgi:hypothetical protein
MITYQRGFLKYLKEFQYLCPFAFNKYLLNYQIKIRLFYHFLRELSKNKHIFISQFLLLTVSN